MILKILCTINLGLTYTDNHKESIRSFFSLIPTVSPTSVIDQSNSTNILFRHKSATVLNVIIKTKKRKNLIRVKHKVVNFIKDSNGDIVNIINYCTVSDYLGWDLSSYGAYKDSKIHCLHLTEPQYRDYVMHIYIPKKIIKIRI